MHRLNIKRNFNYFSVSLDLPNKLTLSKVLTEAQVGASPFLLYWSLISWFLLLFS